MLATAAINARVAYSEIGDRSRVGCVAGQLHCWPAPPTGAGVVELLAWISRLLPRFVPRGRVRE